MVVLVAVRCKVDVMELAYKQECGERADLRSSYPDRLTVRGPCHE